MVKEIEYMPMISFRSALRGFVAGSFMVSGIVNPWGILLQVIMVVAGFLILVDSLLPHGKQPFIVTSVVLFIIGGIASLAATLTGQSVPYLMLAVVLTALVYIHRIGAHVRGG